LRNVGHIDVAGLAVLLIDFDGRVVVGLRFFVVLHIEIRVARLDERLHLLVAVRGVLSRVVGERVGHLAELFQLLIA